MTYRQAIAFVRAHGVVLESANGPVPSLAEKITGAPIRGSWWGHGKSEEIWKLTRRVRASRDVLVCRLVDGKITYVHRYMWPALVRVANRFPRKRLAEVQEIHTASGRHIVKEISFPRWVPADVKRKGRARPTSSGHPTPAPRQACRSV